MSQMCAGGPAGDGDLSPRRSGSPLGPQITPIYVTDERGDRGKHNPLAAAVKLPASSRCTPVAGVTLHDDGAGAGGHADHRPQPRHQVRAADAGQRGVGDTYNPGFPGRVALGRCESGMARGDLTD